MMFGNSFRMLCLFTLTCMLLPHQILSKPVATVALAEWLEKETAKVGVEEVVKELEFYATFNKMIKSLDSRESHYYKLLAREELGLFPDHPKTKIQVINELQSRANSYLNHLRDLASKLDVHDSHLLTVQQFQEIANGIIDRRIPGLPAIDWRPFEQEKLARSRLGLQY